MMYLKKNKLFVSVIATTALLLAACGGEKSEQPGESDDYSPGVVDVETMTISEGIEKYPVWFELKDDMDRNSTLSALYVFEDGNVTRYSNGITDLSVEEMNDLSDDEIVEHVKNSKTGISPRVETGQYSLNIVLDKMGQSTEKVEILTKSGTSAYRWKIEDAMGEVYSGNDDENYRERYPNFDLFVEAVRSGEVVLTPGEDKEIEVDGDYISYIDIIGDEGEIFKTLQPLSLQGKVFDTVYSGLKVGDHAGIFTRVDPSFAGFILDTPNMKGKNVTVEGK